MALLPLGGLLAGCEPLPSRTGASWNSEIDLSSAEPDPSKAPPMAAPTGTAPTAADPKLRPCRLDAAGSCGGAPPEVAATARPPRLNPEQRYTVPLSPQDPTLGNPEAPVTWILFSDYQCPFCARLEPVIREVLERFPTEVRIVWKDFPLQMHDYAKAAAVLAQRAGGGADDQAFWALHNELFARQDELGDGLLQQLAVQRELTREEAQARALVEQSVQHGLDVGVRSTPTSFIDGYPIVGAQPLWQYVDAINDALGRRQTP